MLQHFPGEKNADPRTLFGVSAFDFALFRRALVVAVAKVGRFRPKVKRIGGQTPFPAHGKGADERMRLGRGGHVPTAFHIALTGHKPHVPHKEKAPDHLLFASLEFQAIGTAGGDSFHLNGIPPVGAFAHPPGPPSL